MEKFGRFLHYVFSVIFSTRLGRGFPTPEESVDLWHLPNIGEDLDGPLQPKVVGLDVCLLCRLVELSAEEGRGCGPEISFCWNSGISVGITHPKPAASSSVPDRLLGGGRHMLPRDLEEQRRGPAGH